MMTSAMLPDTAVASHACLSSFYPIMNFKLLLIGKKLVESPQGVPRRQWLCNLEERESCPFCVLDWLCSEAVPGVKISPSLCKKPGTSPRAGYT